MEMLHGALEALLLGFGQPGGITQWGQVMYGGQLVHPTPRQLGQQVGIGMIEHVRYFHTRTSRRPRGSPRVHALLFAGVHEP